MGKIVCIGGGEIKDFETEPIDKYIVELTGKTNPACLLIPTACKDYPDYIEQVRVQYEKLGCTFSSLNLVTGKLAKEQIEAEIFAADIIYVGGGNTIYMLGIWEEYGLKEPLLKAYSRGCVMTGLSAGGICWCNAGHSYIRQRDEQGNKIFKLLDGFSLIDICFCPHYDEAERACFDRMIEGRTDTCIALENKTALVYVDGKRSIIKADKSKRAFIVKNTQGIITKTEIGE